MCQIIVENQNSNIDNKTEDDEKNETFSIGLRPRKKLRLSKEENDFNNIYGNFCNNNNLHNNNNNVDTNFDHLSFPPMIQMPTFSIFDNNDNDNNNNNNIVKIEADKKKK